MNYIGFSVNTTNILPMANSHAGGQLVTEYSLRALSSLDTPESVKYMIGPSYAHSETDFYVQLAGSTDFFSGQNAATSSSILEITPGRAVVNGYFIESLTSVTIDMIALAQQAIDAGQMPLTGDLCVGLRTMFSTEATVAGSLKIENANSMYEGIQIVVLPVGDVVMPVDAPLENQQVNVNMYLKLATFSFLNGNITNIVQNYPGKCQYVPANRIDNIDGIISSDYLKKTGLNTKRLYVYSGKSNDPNVGGDTWCDATDSLFIWGDSIPQYTNTEPAVHKALFDVDIAADTLRLILPHKQVDGMTDSQGNPQYFAPEVLPLPKASFETNTPGIVGAAYTAKVKSILNKINGLYTMPNGKQRMYIEELHDISELPPVNEVWKPGDYIIVARDFTVSYQSTDAVTAPSTMYVVCPGQVTFILHIDGDHPDGVELDRKVVDEEPLYLPSDMYSYQTAYFSIGDYNGMVGYDYFTVVWEHEVDEQTVQTPYYYMVNHAEKTRYSAPILLYGGTPFADVSTVGGFLNVDTTDTDKGYIYLDSEGHLRLLDYGLLRSGTLAYQLGEDFVTPSGLDLNGIQEYLDEYVNQRIAFPNAAQSAKSNPNVINITIDLQSVEDEQGTITLYDIDSRFGTSIYVHLVGSPSSDITVNIADCQRVRIDSSISGSPTINLYRSCLYYDPDVLDIMANITDLSLWYERYSNDDPSLVVNDMTVSHITASGDTVQNYASNEYWSPSNPNDNHFTVALQSITFDGSGYMCGCGLYVRNETTSNVSEGTFLIHDTFELPVGPGLIYPKSRMKKRIKVTGQFIGAYQQSSPSGYMIQETNFSAFTPSYYANGSVNDPGEIAFIVKAYLMADSDPAVIDVWDTGSFNYFEGMTAL